LNQSDIKEKLRIAVEEYNELDSSWVVCTMFDFKPRLIEMLEFTFDCKVCKPFGDKLSLYHHYDSHIIKGNIHIIGDIKIKNKYESNILL
jgi:hypothetical protein